MGKNFAHAALKQIKKKCIAYFITQYFFSKKKEKTLL